MNLLEAGKLNPSPSAPLLKTNFHPMDPISIIGIGSGLLVGAFVTFTEDALDKSLTPIFRFFGFQSSAGPTDIIAKQNGQVNELTITNNGKGKAKLAVTEAIGVNGKKTFPTPYADDFEAKGEVPEKRGKELRKHFISEKTDPGSPKKVYINSAELDEGDLKSISVLDMDGKFWPVTNT